MPLMTLNTGTTYNLRDLMNGTTAGASHTSSEFKSGLVSRLVLKVPTESPGNVYIARNYAGVSSSNYDISLTPNDSFMDVLHQQGNMISMGEFSIVVSANSTLLEVYAIPY